MVTALLVAIPLVVGSRGSPECFDAALPWSQRVRRSSLRPGAWLYHYAV